MSDLRRGHAHASAPGRCLFPVRQPVSHELWQPGLDDAFLHFLKIVGDPADLELLRLRVVDAVARPGIPVPGLAHAARVQDGLVAADLFQRRVGVAEDDHAHLERVEDTAEALVVVLVDELLQPVRAAVVDGEPVQVDVLRQGLEKAQALPRQVIGCPLDGLVRHRAEPLRVTTDHRVVVVAPDALDLVFLEQLHSLVRIRVVPDDVAGTEYGVDLAHVLEHGLERDDVRVYVCNETDLHLTIIPRNH